jgi:hypothetical protein
MAPYVRVPSRLLSAQPARLQNNAFKRFRLQELQDRKGARERIRQ